MKNYPLIYEYVYTHVRNMYASFDGGHDEQHFDEVVKAARDIADHMGMSDDEILTVVVAAAFHDTGRMIDDRRHEEYSVIIFNNDQNMRRWFNKDERQLISNIINEHRSVKGASSIYSRILKDADKAYPSTNRDRWIERVVRYNTDHCNLHRNDPLFKDVITERVMIRLNKLSQVKDWQLPATTELFGPKQAQSFVLPNNEEIHQVIEKYIKERYND